MNWNLAEAITYYRSQGTDQTTLVNLLKEIQQESGGSIPLFTLPQIAESFGVKENFLLALIRRMPSLRLGDTHTLLICAGPNCSKHRAIAEAALKLESKKLSVSFVPCMRLCGKGPNIKWDGKLYHQATPQLLEKLMKESGI
ncbi:MAG: (2Fe-2S) ferredoxin domain-containing protein [Oscillospiraceae bacterium]|nr:(2Fe-2S) ferredoxin domain-containing protein [Oscillospiraceae bacterium]